MIKHLLSIAAGLLPCMALATDIYITPEGNGSKDGSTWDNAMGLTEYYAHMKFVFNSTLVNEAHQGEQYYFSTGTYTFSQTVFVYRSGVAFKGGYDPTTGELAESGRTVFDGNGQERNNGALFIYNNTEINSDNVQDRAVTIEGIDFENFISKGEWRGNETNWQSGRPGAVFVQFCGLFEITDCNFRNNVCKGTGDNAMAGALSLNKVNALVRECSFVGNEGTDGGAIKMYYNQSGDWTKMSRLVVDRCSFSGNKSANRGGAIYGRNAQVLNVINTTMVGNDAPLGGAIFMNTSADYANAANIISSTIAGNTSTDGEQVYTLSKADLKVANSIIASEGDAFAISGADDASNYKFLGNNLIGKVAAGYESAASDDISDDNTQAAVFGANQLAADGTLAPAKFAEGMAVGEIETIVAAQSWNFAVDCAVDQLGNQRSAGLSNGALAVDRSTSGIESVAIDGAADENWYDLRGIKINGQPTQSGLYIHNGKKVIIM